MKIDQTPNLMKAAIITKHGGPEVMKTALVPKPSPKQNQVLVKVFNSSVTTGDMRIRSLNVPTGFEIPVRLIVNIKTPGKNILGGEFSGVIEAIGSEVTKFKVGDEVFGFAGFNSGANAEYTCVNQNGCIAIKPKNLSFEEAAVVAFGGNTSLHFLRLAHLKKGEKILINGASGAVGTAGIQLAKYFGAEVTAVCSADNIELVKSLGADKVIDYTKGNIFGTSDKYDVIYDTLGKISFKQCSSYLNKNGKFVEIVAGVPFYFEMLGKNFINSLTGNTKRIITGTAPDKQENLEFLKKIIEEGKYRPVIDHVYDLEEIAEAHRKVDSGHKKGSVVLQVQ